MSSKVAVLMGGNSFERDISLKSGKRVCDALEEKGHKVIALDTNSELVPTLRSENPDICYIALHGKHGEDGTIQSLLDFLNIPYVGSIAQVCRSVHNKAQLGYQIERYCDLLEEERIAYTASGFCLSQDAFKDMGLAKALNLVSNRFPSGYPVCVKPAQGGSGMGVHKVISQEEIGKAILDALSFDDNVVIEEWIEGIELSVSILGGGWDAHTLPPVEIVSHGEYFTQQDRINPDKVDFYTPVRLESLSPDESNAQSIRSEIERAALQAYLALNCKDLGRVDIIWDGATTRILEIDVSPGLTETSLFPLACEAAGLPLSDVLDRLVQIK